MRSLRAARRESLTVAMKTQHSQKKKKTNQTNKQKNRSHITESEKMQRRKLRKSTSGRGTANAKVLSPELFRGWSVISSSQKLMESLSVFAGGEGKLH